VEATEADVVIDPAALEVVEAALAALVARVAGDLPPLVDEQAVTRTVAPSAAMTRVALIQLTTREYVRRYVSDRPYGATEIEWRLCST
jgi:hypothetical protein